MFTVKLSNFIVLQYLCMTFALGYSWWEVINCLSKLSKLPAQNFIISGLVYLIWCCLLKKKKSWLLVVVGFGFGVVVLEKVWGEGSMVELLQWQLIKQLAMLKIWRTALWWHSGTDLAGLFLWQEMTEWAPRARPTSWAWHGQAAARP